MLRNPELSELVIPDCDELQPTLVEELLDKLNQIAQLPDVKGIYETRRNYVKARYTAGKPWFDYSVQEDVPIQRVRVRERWLTQDAGKRLLAGVVRVQLGKAYAVAPFLDATIKPEDEQHKAKVILESSQEPDHTYSETLHLVKRRNSKATGIITRFGRRMLFDTDFDFGWYPLAEDANAEIQTYVPLHNQNLGTFVDELTKFISDEQELGVERMIRRAAKRRLCMPAY